MKRSAGVTISAAAVLLGSAVTLLFGALMMFASTVASLAPQRVATPVCLGVIVAVEAVLFFGFGGWGLASGVGLILLKQWARISTLVFSGILAGICLPAAAVISLIPSSTFANQPGLPPNFGAMLRVGLILFYAFFAALGVFWLFFFNRQAVKAQFAPRAAPQPGRPSTLVTAAPAALANARPLSITIIGWFLLVASPLGLLYFLFWGRLFHGTRMPMYFLGHFFSGRDAILVFGSWAVVQTVAAWGLLKLKNWAWLTTVVLQFLTIANSTLVIIIPSHRAHLQQIMESTMAAMEPQMRQPFSFTPPVWIGFVFSTPIVLVVLFFLFRARPAFSSGPR